MDGTSALVIQHSNCIHTLLTRVIQRPGNPSCQSLNRLHLLLASKKVCLLNVSVISQWMIVIVSWALISFSDTCNFINIKEFTSDRLIPSRYFEQFLFHVDQLDLQPAKQRLLQRWHLLKMHFHWSSQFQCHTMMH